jgi:hypothetical protein
VAAVFAGRPAYDARVLPPFVIGLALGLALVVLAPSRRLYLAGLDPRWIGLYATIMWLGSMLVVLLPGLRFLVPILIVTWVAPFVVAPERLSRVLHGGRRDGGRFARNVTPGRGSRPPGSGDGL